MINWLLIFTLGALAGCASKPAQDAHYGDRASVINHTTYNGSAGMVCYPMNGKQTCYRQGN